MLNLFFMLFVLQGTTEATSMVYFSTKTGLVFNKNQADIKFGMKIGTVRTVIKNAKVNILSEIREDGEVHLNFKFYCKSDNCNINDGDLVSLNFIDGTLVGISILTKTAKKCCADMIIKIYKRTYDYACSLKMEIDVTAFGWVGDVKTTLTVFDYEGIRTLLLDIRIDKFRYDFNSSQCSAHEGKYNLFVD